MNIKLGNVRHTAGILGDFQKVVMELNLTSHMKPVKITWAYRYLRILPVFVTLTLGCHGKQPDPPKAGNQTSPQPTASVETEKQVIEFCGDCHRTPSAEHFPKIAWYEEVKRGYGFFDSSERTDLVPPPQDAVVRFFQSQAPEKLHIPAPKKSHTATLVKFRKTQFDSVENAGRPLVAMASLSWIRNFTDHSPELFGCDMRRGELLQFGWDAGHLTSKAVARTPHPCQVRVCDLDGDGKTELAVADLGTFLPGDHNKGAIFWLRADGQKYAVPTPLLQQIGRISDIQPVDLDLDGDQDLLVAEFGWHKTGGIHLLENRGTKDGTPDFRAHKLDGRSGTIHLSVADLNQDGRPDFIALISQEHETVVAFLNEGDLKFRLVTIGDPQDPSFGSSGMTVLDFDLDQDLDVLLTNGDTFDSYYLKPAHGIEWLENQGDLRFRRNSIAKFPGVYRALAGDLDGDGDNDIVAVSMLSSRLLAQQPDNSFDGLIWLEQKSIGEFVWRSLETGNCRHTALELQDFDADGDLDLAVANFGDEGDEPMPPLTLWWNLRIDRTADR